MMGVPAGPRPARGRNSLLYFMIALVVVLAAAAVWFVVAWVRARDDRAAAIEAQARASAAVVRAEHDDSITFARARDEAERAGEDAVTVFNTLDYRTVDAGLDAWERASTGPLHDDVVGRRAQSRQAIVDAKSATTASVLSSAFTALDARAGTATMIVAVRVTLTPNGGQPQQKYQRFQAELRRTGDGWKLSGLNLVEFAAN